MPQQYNPENSPEKNLEVLASNPYPGRFLAVGFGTGGIAVQAYAIGGRSEGSQNRVLVEEDGIVSTEVFNPILKTGDPALTIYDAMRRRGSVHVVSNGDQTGTAIQYLRSGKTFADAMETRDYEPDAPNYTPRISGYIQVDPESGEKELGISIIRKMNGFIPPVSRSLYSEPDLVLENGVGYGVHTYLGNGDPLPAYDEKPFKLPILDNAKDMAQMVWDHLNPDTRVAVAAKVIHVYELEPAYDHQEIHIINRHETTTPIA